MNILLLVHIKLVPPLGPQARARVVKSRWRTEYDVREALKRLGHSVDVVGIDKSLLPLIQGLDRKPDMVFNLLEEFGGEAVFDQSIVGLLELSGIPFTGCNGRGMALARDKSAAKKIVQYHGVATPGFMVVSRRMRKWRVPLEMKFPMIVKYLNEEASLGISSKNVVHNLHDLKSVVETMLERFDADVLVEEFVSGREVYVAVWGNEKLEVLPARELRFGRLPTSIPRIASSRMKWNADFRKAHGVHTRQIPESESKLLRELKQTTRSICQALRINGYARVDYRLDDDGQIHFIEANPNPQVCRGEDFADAALASGWDYDQVIHRILELGKRARGNPAIFN